MFRFLTNRLSDSRWWQFVLVVYWLALLIGTHLPQETPLVPVVRSDKLAHLTAFAVLAWLLAATWQFSAGRLSAAHLRWLWIAIAIYAVADEWTQQFVGRQASAADWLADMAGVLIGLAWFRWRNRTEQEAPPQ